LRNFFLEKVAKESAKKKREKNGLKVKKDLA